MHTLKNKNSNKINIFSATSLQEEHQPSLSPKILGYALDPQHINQGQPHVVDNYHD